MWIVILLAVLLVAAVLVWFALGYGDPEVSRRCPECGLQELTIVYPGHVQVMTRFECRACGAAYRESPEGSLVREH